MTNFAFWFTFLIQVTTSLILALVISIPLILFLYWLHLRMIKKNIPQKVIEKAEKQKLEMKGGGENGYLKRFEGQDEKSGELDPIRDRIRKEIRERRLTSDSTSGIRGESTDDYERSRLSDERYDNKEEYSPNDDPNRRVSKRNDRGWKRF